MLEKASLAALWARDLETSSKAGKPIRRLCKDPDERVGWLGLKKKSQSQEILRKIEMDGRNKGAILGQSRGSGDMT